LQRVSAPDELDRLLEAAQTEQRMPSVSAAAFRDGELLWERAIGLADVERGEAATPDHVYRIGSITKTFTAVLVLQLREEDVLRLEDELRAHVGEVAPGPTVRQALAHLSGIQREPPGEIWETLQPPSREELLAGLVEAEQVLSPGDRWHYSNLAYGLLGELVARLRGASYRDEATAALGQLWSTTGDLARFAAFLARGDERVLACRPR
jgi:CubicO group peptidase (beta-lactamase class C family)